MFRLRRRKIIHPDLDDFKEDDGQERIPEEIEKANELDDEEPLLEDNDGEGDRLSHGRLIPDSDNQFRAQPRRAHKEGQGRRIWD